MKRIVIVGATSGIGLKVAVKLALQGHRVGVAGRKTNVMKSLKRHFPEQVEWEEIDVTKGDGPKHLLRLIEKLGGMDCYFHVAGIGFVNPELKPDEELATVRTNAEGFVRMIDCAYSYFRDECGGRGHIAAITSVAGTRGIGPLAAYSATKKFGQAYLEALDQLSRSKGMHIKFTDIRPGWIRTPLLDADEEYPMTMTLSYAAPRIIKSLSRRCRVNYIDWRWGMVAGLMKMVPPCLWVRLRIPVSKLATPAETLKNAEVEASEKRVPDVGSKK